MDKVSREELFRRLEAIRKGTLSKREIYRAIQAFGEMNFQEARPEVERLLHHEEPELRHVALKVLTRYWRLPEHWKTAREVLEHDPDAECRIRAATDLGSLKMNTQDKATLAVLAQVVQNQQEDFIVRASAYAAMKAVLHYDPREQFHLAAHSLDFEHEVDWELVNSYL